jgi:hypothetical protein
VGHGTHRGADEEVDDYAFTTIGDSTGRAMTELNRGVAVQEAQVTSVPHPALTKLAKGNSPTIAIATHKRTVRRCE